MSGHPGLLREAFSKIGSSIISDISVGWVFDRIPQTHYQLLDKDGRVSQNCKEYAIITMDYVDDLLCIWLCVIWYDTFLINKRQL